MRLGSKLPSFLRSVSVFLARGLSVFLARGLSVFLALVARWEMAPPRFSFADPRRGFPSSLALPRAGPFIPLRTVLKPLIWVGAEDLEAQGAEDLEAQGAEPVYGVQTSFSLH